MLHLRFLGPRFLRRLSPLASAVALALLIASVYAPFLGTRLLRMAGDEKVYISQALEMERDGRWFVQTLQDEPNYYKGPFHYLALRAGFKVFGRNPWAVLYMNLFLLIAGSVALASTVRRRFPEWIGGDLWVGSAFALCVGIYAHTWASQMEVEVASLFAVGLCLLDRLNQDQAGWSFWGLCGLIGWVKSPLHAALLGTSALFFWTIVEPGCQDLLARLRNPKAWLAVFFGIAVCALGYLPAATWDWKNFWEAYVLRETFGKGDTGQHWSVSIVSSFGFYLIPWMLLAFVSYFHLLAWAPRLLHRSSTKRLLLLGISGYVPSVVFFLLHPYHFENYNLPVISGIWLMVGTTWGSLAATRDRPSRGANFWLFLYAASIAITALAILLIPIGLTALVTHFSPMPDWWPHWLMPLIWVGSLITVLGFFAFGVKSRGRRPDRLAIVSVGFLWGLSALFSVLGERELIDLRRYLADKSAHGEAVSLGYYNLNHNIWSEWGYLNFWVPHEVHGLHSPESLRSAVSRGETILVTSKENSVQEFKDFMAKEFPGKSLKFIPWKRWRTQGKAENGDSLWKAAWNLRDLSLLETDYFIVETKP